MAKLFVLSESAYQRGTDYDVVMLYQVLLGRNPENSQVIQDHRANPLNVAFQTFINSQEFRDTVRDPIGQGAPLRRHDIVPRPSAEQLNWLFSRTLLDDADRTTLRQAASWESFFQHLMSLDGFLEPMPAPPPRAPRPTIPFRPSVRPHTPQIVPPPAPPILPPELAESSNAALMARLERIEAMLTELTRLVIGAQPAGGSGSGGESAPKVKPSSRRQAR